MKYFFISLTLILYSNSSNCQIGKSLVLNGCTDFLEIEESDLLDYNEVLSIECWIAPNCDSGHRIIIGKEWCAGEWSYYLSVQEGRLNWRFSDDGNCTPDSYGFRSVDPVIPTDEFTHVAVVHDQSEIRLFVNGEKIEAEYTSGFFSPIFNSNQEFRVGTYKGVSGNFGNFFSGLIDDIRVWNIPLTEDIIQSNMNAQLSGDEDGLVLFLDMESNSSGSAVTLHNQAYVSENLIANAVGFTSQTPYFIDPLEYYINPLNLEDQYYICNDNLDLSIDIDDYKNILWSTGLQSNTITISEAGTYSVSVETEACKFFTKTFEVFILETVHEEENVYICAEDTYEFHGLLLPPNTTAEFTVPGMLGCDTILTINVFELPKEESSFLGDDIYACISTVSLTSPYENTVWNEDFTGPEFIISEEGLYIAEASDDLGCVFYDSIWVTFELLFEQLSVAICKEDFYDFNGELLPPNSSSTFVVQNKDGCDSTILIHVLETPPLEASFLGDDITSCTNVVTIQSPYENTLWNNDFIGPNLVVTENGLYHAVGTDDLGCTFLDSIEVFFEIPFKEIVVDICKEDFYSFQEVSLPINTSSSFIIEGTNGCDTNVLIHVLETPTQDASFLGDDILTCNKQEIVLSPYDSTTYNGELSGPELIVNEPGVYYAVATDSLGCSYSDSIFVDFHTITKEVSVQVCKDAYYSFNGELLSPNSSYERVLENESGCDTILTINVDEAESFNIFETDIISICQNEVLLSSQFDSTIWNSEFIAREYKAVETGYYFAEALDPNGCFISDTIFVELLNPEIYLPNVISKSSHLNNCFKPTFFNSKPHNYSLKIFDRWGNMIFSKSGIDVEWCGYYNSKLVENGVYVYILELENSCNGTNRKTGTLTVI